MRTIINTYCLLFGVILGFGIIYSGIVNNDSKTVSWNKTTYIQSATDINNSFYKIPTTDTHKSTFHLQNLSNNLGIDYCYQGQNFVLSPKNGRNRIGFYTHLKI